MEVSRIFWDTALFIYMIEEAGSLGEQARELASRMQKRDDSLYASTMTLGEVLTGPARSGNQQLAETYEQLFAKHLALVPFDQGAARQYAQIRVDKSIDPPDAIQLACAAHAEVDLFVTNDKDLAKKTVSGVKFIALLDRVPI